MPWRPAPAPCLRPAAVPAPAPPPAPARRAARPPARDEPVVNCEPSGAPQGAPRADPTQLFLMSGLPRPLACTPACMRTHRPRPPLPQPRAAASSRLAPPRCAPTNRQPSPPPHAPPPCPPPQRLRGGAVWPGGRLAVYLCRGVSRGRAGAVDRHGLAPSPRHARRAGHHQPPPRRAPRPHGQGEGAAVLWVLPCSGRARPPLWRGGPRLRARDERCPAPRPCSPHWPQYRAPFASPS